VLSRFLYFLPGLSGCSEKMLQSLGLYDRFVGAGGRLGAWVMREIERGPENRDGCMVAAGQRPPEFNAAVQTWMRVDVPGKKPDVYFIGIENNAAPPGPDDLNTPFQIDGYGTRLGDGRVWYVPRVLRWDTEKCEHQSALPQALIRRIVDGRPRVLREIQPAYKLLDEIGRRTWESYLSGVAVPYEQVFHDVTALLSANYRIGVDEISLLGLLDDESLQEVLSLAIDMPAIRAQGEDLQARGLLRADCPADRDEMARGSEVSGG